MLPLEVFPQIREAVVREVVGAKPADGHLGCPFHDVKIFPHAASEDALWLEGTWSVAFTKNISGKSNQIKQKKKK